MEPQRLALSPEWAALWTSREVEARRSELERILRSSAVRDPYVMGRVQGSLDALEWLEALPARLATIEQRRTDLRGEE